MWSIKKREDGFWEFDFSENNYCITKIHTVALINFITPYMKGVDCYKVDSYKRKCMDSALIAGRM